MRCATEEDSRCENNLYRGRTLGPRGPLQSLGAIERAGAPGAYVCRVSVARKLKPTNWQKSQLAKKARGRACEIGSFRFRTLPRPQALRAPGLKGAKLGSCVIRQRYTHLRQCGLLNS
jgi:hypothetical protein